MTLAALELLGLDVRMLLVVAGFGQLVLASASLAVPRVLGWREEVRQLQPITRQAFWTYAAYVLGAHVSFGLLSALRPDLLLDGTPLARATCAFIGLWWSVRLIIAFLGPESREFQDRPGVLWVDRLLRVVFAGLAFGYAYVALSGDWVTP